VFLEVRDAAAKILEHTTIGDLVERGKQKKTAAVKGTATPKKSKNPGLSQST
jgi:hypothetical protein